MIKIEKPTKEQLDNLKIDSWSEWSCEKSSFEWEYASQETAYVKEGRVVVNAEDKDYEIRAGDLVVFPKGLKCTWNVLERLKKVYKFK